MRFTLGGIIFIAIIYMIGARYPGIAQRIGVA